MHVYGRALNCFVQLAGLFLHSNWHWQDLQVLVKVPVVGPLLGGSPAVLGDLLQHVIHWRSILSGSTSDGLATHQVHPGLIVGIDIDIENSMGGCTTPVPGRSGCRTRGRQGECALYFHLNTTNSGAYLWPQGHKTGLATAAVAASFWLNTYFRRWPWLRLNRFWTIRPILWPSDLGQSATNLH